MRLNGRRIPLPIYHSRSVLVAIEDITQRRQQAEIRYRRLFETAKDGMLLMDPETSTIEDANPFFSELVGVPREALIGKNVADIPNFATGPNGLTILTRALDEGAVRYSELPLLRQSGDTVWVDVIANRYELGGRTSFRRISEMSARPAPRVQNYRRAKTAFAAS